MNDTKKFSASKQGVAQSMPPIPEFLTKGPAQEGEVRRAVDVTRRTDVSTQMQAREPNSLEARAMAGVEAMNLLVAERDTLRRELADAQNLNHVYEQRLEMTENELSLQRARAEHYERYTTEFVTHIRTFEMLINDMKTKARNAAFNPSPIERNALAAVAAELDKQ